ncbi:hypothetical protein Kpol_1065p2 [Vanderwaltozyma polyspora DSM 70294]|uniref:Signal recognition particle subunit SRP72 n=1 Tax=Vanderwaltozyma polyspora (strain ATCC 22028 / DSM 70294 / BCRC 21397 / CBS 2163 / NBRC 10782 / NRRL Y-8283 / UCD 57-17) TaxID=436907 RepID=A7TL27_VANPO|nr:uncharacterized protein Kpol_1065p2 [Vanderwaltozyma polyspora DSM 70294]EDO16990.1 hypothetical protein Kpol_1065p2 [Vanderwaltozyma polyspora DSM 70294]
MARDNLTQLLGQLNVQSSKDEHSKVQETCLNLLENQCANAADVLRHYLVACIKQDNYQKALDVLKKFKKVDESAGDSLILEKLYIYYKLNLKNQFERLFEGSVLNKLGSLETVDVNSERLRGILHVRAQFCYKNGKYDESFKIYQLLATKNNSGLDNVTELACNERVPLTAYPDLIKYSQLITKVNDNSYDLLFNESIILSSNGDYTSSISLLKKALDMAKKEDYQLDIDTIELQLAYVHQLNYNKSEAKSILKSLLERLDKKSPLSLIAKMNLLSFNDFSKYSDNLNLLLRELNYDRLVSLDLQNLTNKQWKSIQNNLLFLRLYNNSSIQSKDSVLSRTLHNYQKVVNDSVNETYESQAKKLYHNVITSMQSGIEGNLIGQLLLSLQLQIVVKNWDNAIRLCELFLKKSWNTVVKISENDATVCYALFELYNLVNRSSSKAGLLQRILSSKSESSIAENVAFWKHVGFQLLSIGQVNEGTELLQEILNDPSSVQNIEFNELIESILSKEEFSKDKGISLVEDIDTEKLIIDGVSPLESSSYATKVSKSSKIQKKKLAHKEKKKAKKLAKFMTNRDASKTPDPERWLALIDRSTYRPKNKKQLAKQTQGGAMNKKAEQSLDITKSNVPKKSSGPNKNKKKKGRK